MFELNWKTQTFLWGHFVVEDLYCLFFGDGGWGVCSTQTGWGGCLSFSGFTLVMHDGSESSKSKVESTLTEQQCTHAGEDLNWKRHVKCIVYPFHVKSTPHLPRNGCSTYFLLLLFFCLASPLELVQFACMTSRMPKVQCARTGHIQLFTLAPKNTLL